MNDRRSPWRETLLSWSPWLLLILRLGLAAVFFHAASSKVLDLGTFAQDTANYQLLPAALVPVFSVGLIGVEILAGVALVLGFWPRAAASVLLGLLVAFIIALLQAIMRDIDLRCGCFGGEELVDWGTIGRDFIYVAMALPIIRWGGGAWSLRP